MIKIKVDGPSCKIKISPSRYTFGELFSLILCLMNQLDAHTTSPDLKAKLFAAIGTYCYAPHVAPDDFMAEIMEEGGDE